MKLMKYCAQHPGYALCVEWGAQHGALPPSAQRKLQRVTPHTITETQAVITKQARKDET